MNCNETRKWMSPYLDSELGATKTFEVSEHLQTCPPCSKRYDVERRADAMMRDRLSEDVMPSEVWTQLVYAVSTPTWVRALVSRRSWAIAACLVLAAVGVLAIRSTNSAQAAPSIVQQFLAEAPGNKPFSASTPAIDPSALDSLLQDALGVAFSVADITATGHKPFEVVSTETRTDADGYEYVEVRLNCCGKPVLLALAKAKGGAFPDKLIPFADTVANESLRSFDGVKVGVRNLGDVRIVVASRHALDNVLAALSRVTA